jgi:Zn-dependent peptidase ImmA (M78 family)
MMENTPDSRAALHRAKEIVKDLSIEEPSHIDLEAIAFHLGAVVKQELMTGADGRLATLGSQGLITVREDIPEEGRKRFVMAHELGHYELHRQKVPLISCSEDDFLKWNADNQHLEVEANYFAGELLMPEEMFRKRLVSKALSLALLESLYVTFSVSLTAAAIRFVTLRPEYALVCSSSDRIKWFVIDSKWCPLYLNIKGKVHPESMAYEYFQGNSLPKDFCTVEPDAWTDYSIRGKLKELSIPLGRYDQVLSFLEVEESLDG